MRNVPDEPTDIHRSRFTIGAMNRRLPSVLFVLALIAAGCSSSADTANTDATSTESAVEPADTTSTTVDRGPDGREGPAAEIDPDSVPRGELVDFGPAPATTDGPLDPEVIDALDLLFFEALEDGIVIGEERDAIDAVGASGDARLAWLLSDLLRIAQEPSLATSLGGAATELTGVELSPFSSWNTLTNHLIAWDTPAPPDYLRYKRALYTLIEPAWDDLMEDGRDDLIDWRFVSWGGVRIDNRPFDTTDDPCNCIPAADNPEVESAAEADWLDDDDVIFGVVINGEARAYPRRIMEVREMVNDTLGGRDFAMPYCTLCGAAQVWFTDELPAGVERPVLRTSGLLSRSNKLMYDLTTMSFVDTFLGIAQTGPLADIGYVFEPHTVVTSTWGQWVADHPETTVLIEDLALGRDFDFRNGRDADGPIFPIGDVDPRLPVQADVVGVTTPAGEPLAFHLETALSAIGRGEVVEVDGIRLIRRGDGLVAESLDGEPIAAHQAFWFAWSQFHPDTALWPDVS